ncbi:unnamed protein product [Rangifer tarandus platyrhynchus]|uniref:Uncharacterized protein n=2 Tax=Rangifer tarandus platyrhynchus TaxID=3082113 RepID=A0ABN8XW93_RANTA|nr:unnamed protein product [Rangifer tarandus platyrhynchus]CAI9692469.1 unnamed protein product [Rangifer tarandus platyrhynchus]
MDGDPGPRGSVTSLCSGVEQSRPGGEPDHVHKGPRGQEDGPASFLEARGRCPPGGPDRTRLRRKKKPEEMPAREETAGGEKTEEGPDSPPALAERMRPPPHPVGALPGAPSAGLPPHSTRSPPPREAGLPARSITPPTRRQVRGGPGSRQTRLPKPGSRMPLVPASETLGDARETVPTRTTATPQAWSVTLCSVPVTHELSLASASLDYIHLEILVASRRLEQP